jgi:DNA-binding NtrC family response regulator
VRELSNVLERAVMMNETRRLTAEHFARVLPAVPAAATKASNDETPSAARSQRLAHAIADAERQAILAALASTHGNKLAAAQQLGISRAALYQKLSALGLVSAK